MKEHVLLWKAVHALEIDLPILSYEILGPDAIRLNLYGGQVVAYTFPPADTAAEKTGTASTKRKAGARRGAA